MPATGTRSLIQSRRDVRKLAGGASHRCKYRHETAGPGRGVGLNVTFVEFYTAAAQQLQILLAKRARPMMRRLLLNDNGEPLGIGKR